MPETDSSSLPARPPALGGGPPIVEPPVPIDEIAVGQSRINFSWLLKIRWAAVAGQLCTVLVVSLYLGVELPLVWLFSIISFAALTNAVLVLWFRRQLSSGRWQHRARRSPLIIGWIMVLDILLLTALLYVSGGPSFAFKLKEVQEEDGEETPRTDDTKKYDVGFAFGGGVSFGRWIVDARYTLGVTDIVDIDFPFSAPSTSKNRSFALTAGYRWR